MTDQSNISIEYVDPAELTPAAYNPRTISEEALDRLAGLLDTHGFVDPIIARAEDRLVVGGHQRLKANALRERPDTRVPVVFLAGVSDAQAKALNIALNNTEAQGAYDQTRLADLLAEIDATGIDLSETTGFPPDDVDSLLASLDETIREPEIPEAYQVVVECDDECDQRTTYERLTAEGRTCRVLTL